MSVIQFQTFDELMNIQYTQALFILLILYVHTLL